MSQSRYNLAIETSSRRAAIALGIDDQLLEVAELPPQRRQNLDLLPCIDMLTQKHGLTPAGLIEVCVSLGPGSFTGLRVAVASAKMLAMTLGCRVIGIPTLDVLRAQHPGAMVCLHVKRGTAWSAGPGFEPSLRSLDEIDETGLPLIADTLEHAQPAEPDVRQLWQLGRAAAAAQRYDDPLTLSPLYIREPEAVTLWDQRHGTAEP